MPEKNVLFVLDDNFRIRALMEALKQKWPVVWFGFQTMDTEYEFRCNFDKIAVKPPDLVITRQMIKYCDEQDAEDLIHPQDMFKGGERCFDWLREDARTKNVPVIFFETHGLVVPAGALCVREGHDKVEVIMKRFLKAARGTLRLAQSGGWKKTPGGQQSKSRYYKKSDLEEVNRLIEKHLRKA